MQLSVTQVTWLAPLGVRLGEAVDYAPVLPVPEPRVRATDGAYEDCLQLLPASLTVTASGQKKNT